MLFKKLNEEIQKAKNEVIIEKITNDELIFENILEKIEETIRGGLSDNMTIEKIAEKHKTTVDAIKSQIEKGKKVEMEHTDDPKEAELTAMDHLVEIPDYYDRLEKMEEDAKKELNEAVKILTEAAKTDEVKEEAEEARSFFGGKKIEGIDTNRFIRLWNRIRDTFKMRIHLFLKLLNPLNWPGFIFIDIYNIIKVIANIGTREVDSIRLEYQELLRNISDGKYRGKPAKSIYADLNTIRKKHGFKPHSFLENAMSNIEEMSVGGIAGLDGSSQGPLVGGKIQTGNMPKTMKFKYRKKPTINNVDATPVEQK
jgi:hypothetical protein